MGDVPGALPKSINVDSNTLNQYFNALLLVHDNYLLPNKLISNLLAQIDKLKFQKNNTNTERFSHLS